MFTGEIKYSLGKKEVARLRYSESEDGFSLESIIVPFNHRGCGIGTSLIRRLLVLADGMKKEVLTSARPIGSVDSEKVERLVRFYEKFDFQVYERGVSAVYMKRENTA